MTLADLRRLEDARATERGLERAFVIALLGWEPESPEHGYYVPTTGELLRAATRKGLVVEVPFQIGEVA